MRAVDFLARPIAQDFFGSNGQLEFCENALALLEFF